MKNHWIRYWGALTAALLFCTNTIFPIAMHSSADSSENLEIRIRPLNEPETAWFPQAIPEQKQK